MSDRATGRACERVALWASRRPRLVVGLAVAVTLTSLLMTGRLQISGSLGDAVGAASPAARAISTIGARFDVGKDLLVLATVSDADKPVAAQETLVSFAKRLSEAVAADPRADDLVRDVSWRQGASADAWLDEVGLPGAPLLLDDPGFAALIERLDERAIANRVRRVEALIAAPGPLAQGAAAEAVADPLDVRGLLVEAMRRRAGSLEGFTGGDLALSRDGRSLLVRIAGKAGPDDLNASKRLVALVREKAEQAALAEVRFELAGAPAIAAHSGSSIRADLIRSVVGAVVAVQALFLIVYRGGGAFLLVTMPAGMGILWAFGTHGLWSGELTALGAAIGAILVGLGVDYAIHTVSGADARDGADTGARAIGRVGAGVVGAAVTTIIAFAALATSRLEILHGFATIGATGLLGAMIATIVLMPLLIGRRIGPRRFALLQVGASQRADRLAIGASALVAIACVIAIVTAAAGPRGIGGVIPLDDRLDAMHPSPNPPLSAQRRVEEEFGSSGEGLPVLVQAGDEVELVRRLHEVSSSLASAAAYDAGVVGVIGLDALVALPSIIEMRRGVLAELDVGQIEGGFRRAVADGPLVPGALDDAIAALHKMLRTPRVPTLDDVRTHPELARLFLPVDGEAPPAAVSYVLVGRPLERRSDRAEVIGAVSGSLTTVAGATVTGLPALGYETERLALNEAPRLLAIAMGGALVWLGLYFRRPGDVLLALLPGAFAFVVLIAMLGLLDVRLNIISMAAFPLLVGIGVDDGIFLVSAARDARNERRPAEALRRRLGEVRHAIVTTSLTTLVAFGSLILTSTPAIQSLGLLVGIGVLACLWGALLLLAPILMLHAQRADTGAPGAAP